MHRESDALLINGDDGNYGSTEGDGRENSSKTRKRRLEDFVIAVPTFDPKEMRDKLDFFFRDPIEKWQIRRRFPYKLAVQIIKLILVTMQLGLFARSRSNHIAYSSHNQISFSHLFLKGWDPTQEILAYPPSAGPPAVYFKEDFYDTIDYAITRYANLSAVAGPYSYPTENNTIGSINFCFYQYRNATVQAYNESYYFDPHIEINCLFIPSNEIENGIREIFKSRSIEINFEALVKATLDFSIKTVNLKARAPLMAPDCYRFDIQILFDNEGHDGQILLSLESAAIRLICHGNAIYTINYKTDAALHTAFNSLVVLTCLISLVLCSRALFNANSLKTETSEFFLEYFRKDLSVDGRLEFVNLWYVMIVTNDVLLIMGSLFKEQIDRKEFKIDDWRNCSVFLGLGTMLVWFGILRYLGFFKTYNVVMLTLKRAAPKMVRFLICALIIFAGFAFCGWMVFGPYHMKFRTLASTSECLFSLINGDDMFATFFSMSQKSPLLWTLSRIYLYVFISLFIYVILSLFVSVIVDSFETIKDYYKNGFPKSDLRKFIEGIDEYKILN